MGSSIGSVTETQVANWYAVYTSVNQERKVATRFEQRGIEFYLPLYRTIRRRSDRQVVLSLPLFPGYIFAHIPLGERRRVLETPRVVRLAGDYGRPLAVSEEEIALLRRGLSGQVHAEPHKYLTEGCRVRVVNGPFEGTEGILLRYRRGTRVAVSLRVIMQSFTIEVGEGDVERI
jgi:transcription antitermination factor NusG